MDKERMTEQEEKELFTSLRPDYSRSREDVWKAMEAMMEETPVQRRPARIFSLNRTLMSMAAMVTLFVCITLAARFYTESHHVPNGAMAAFALPDGSQVEVNAGSDISWHPYWWRFSREVQLSGEAFFEVEKGETFAVISEQGRTEVLGTSFNVYAREDGYRVLCLTGKVSVTEPQGGNVILTPEMFAGTEVAQGELLQIEEFSRDAVLSWRLNRFIYNSTPLEKVFRDVERHYDIRILVDSDSLTDRLYTGLFERSVSPEDALEIICYSYGLRFDKQDDKTFLVRKN